MGIELNYANDPRLIAQAAYESSGAPVLEEIRRYEEQMGQRQFEQDRRFDLDAQQIALRDQLARYQMGQQAAQFGAQLQATNYNNELDYDIQSQQLAQRDEQLGVQAALQAQQQQQLTSRTQLSQLGQIARQQQQQKFELAMAERKSGEEWMRTATPRQQQQFRQRWEQTHGMPWTAPEEALAAQEDEQQQARRQQWVGMLQAPDGSGELIVPENVADMLMGMEPEKAMNSYTKMLDTWQRRKKDEQAAQTTEMQWEETKANMQRDDERANQMLQHTQQSAEQRMSQAEMLHQQRLQHSARLAFNKAKADWLKLKNDPLATDVGPEPKPEEYGVIEEKQISGPPKSITTQAEYDALGPGEEYIDATTGARARK